MTKWAVHNFHTESVEIDEEGCMRHGKETIKLPEPLYVAATREDAEAWRAAHNPTTKR